MHQWAGLLRVHAREYVLPNMLSRVVNADSSNGLVPSDNYQLAELRLTKTWLNERVNPIVTDGFPHKGPVMRISFPYPSVSMSLCHRNLPGGRP